jgi:hypothetical protein
MPLVHGEIERGGPFPHLVPGCSRPGRSRKMATRRPARGGERRSPLMSLEKTIGSGPDRPDVVFLMDRRVPPLSGRRLA